MIKQKIQNTPCYPRETYVNDEEIRDTWHDCKDKIYEEYQQCDKCGKFLSQFDPTCLYNDKWWEKTLCQQWDGYLIRKIFISMLSFSIPTKESLAKLTKFVGKTPVMEYMAGSGYWSYFLHRDFGLNVTSTDIHFDRFAVSHGKTFVPIASRDIRFSKCVDSSILLSWIPYRSVAVNGFLKKMKLGQKLIVIGEQEGGCCASESTFSILNNKFVQEDDVPLIQFNGVHDRMIFYTRK